MDTIQLHNPIFPFRLYSHRATVAKVVQHIALAMELTHNREPTYIDCVWDMRDRDANYANRRRLIAYYYKVR